MSEYKNTDSIIRNLNVWMINHYATGMSKSLAGRHYSFAQKLVQRGYKVSIICANTSHNSDDIVETGKEGFCVKNTGNVPFVFIKSAPYKTNYLDRIWNMYTFAHNVIKLKKKLLQIIGMPDVIIASSVHPLTCVAGLKLGKHLKVPVIVEIRDLWPETLVSLGVLRKNSMITKILYFVEKIIYKRADAVIFTMEGGSQYIIDKNWTDVVDLGKVFYINNGVDLKRFDQNAIVHTVCDHDLDCSGQLNFVYTGSLRRANNMILLINAFKNMNNCKAKLLIWGIGDQAQQLEDYCISENITNVVFKGAVKKDEIPSIITRSYVNVLHSAGLDVHKYGMSQNKLFEYLASGKPILATTNHGYNIVDRSLGGITSDGTLEDIVKKLKSMIALSEKEYCNMSCNSRQAAELFDFVQLTDKLEQVIDYVSSEH